MMLLLVLTTVGRPDNRKFGVHVTGSGSGGGRRRRAADDVGVVAGVDHVNGELGQRAERLAALDTAQDAATSPFAASRQPHVLTTH